MLGQPNDLLDRLENDPAFSQVRLRQVLDPQRFIGRAPEQVEQFIEAVVNPIRQRYGEALKQSITLRV
jgi:adenylosuccinate lyase